MGCYGSGGVYCKCSACSCLPGGRHQRVPAASKGPWTIDLSNTSLNNGWRLEMQAVAKLAAQTAPLNHEVHFNIVNAANTVAGQIQSVDSMIAGPRQRHRHRCQ